jgi:hypothetical protein
MQVSGAVSNGTYTWSGNTATLVFGSQRVTVTASNGTLIRDGAVYVPTGK